MKKRILLFICSLLEITLAHAQFSGSGSGTESDPYKIFNPVQLDQVRNFVGQSGVYFTLMSDLNMSEYIADNNPNQGWQPIGSESQPFQGVFTGNGHKVSGLYINRTADHTGFWGSISNATVTGLTLSFSDNCKGGNYTGAFAGNIENSIVSNCPVSGIAVVGSDYTGGYIGYNHNSQLQGCDAVFSSSISGQSVVGGYIGFNDWGIINQCNLSCKNVEGQMYVGGYIGKQAERLKFADNLVESICIANWDKDGDKGFSIEEAIEVYDLGDAFSENNMITSFDELGSFKNLKNISKYAFSGCTSLSSITIPNSVSSIGYSAFSGCTSLPVTTGIRYADTYLLETVNKDLSSYQIKEGTKWIGYKAFENCNNMNSITIPNSVIFIDSYAFSNCSNLRNIRIPDSVQDFGTSPFDNCGSLPQFNSAVYADTYLVGVPSTSTGANWEISNGTRWIGTRAFAYNTYLKAVTIPNTVKSIETSAFSGCTALQSINIPSSVVSIKGSAFYECKALTSIAVGGSVSSIGAYAFGLCTSLTSIHLPASVKNIDGSAFASCSKLSSIYCDATIPPSTSFTGDGDVVGAILNGNSAILYVPNSALQTYIDLAPNYKDRIKGF